MEYLLQQAKMKEWYIRYLKNCIKKNNEYIKKFKFFIKQGIKVEKSKRFIEKAKKKNTILYKKIAQLK